MRRKRPGRMPCKHGESPTRLSSRGICIAAIAQLVERKLPKLEVAGSKPVRRFIEYLLIGYLRSVLQVRAENPRGVKDRQTVDPTARAGSTGYDALLRRGGSPPS